MVAWKVIDNTATDDGDDLVLSLREDEWVVHTGPTLLMSSKAHYSEDAMAEVTLKRLASPKTVLVGGLGMGFTLRATLDQLPADGHVVLAETSVDLVRWNREHFTELNGNPLSDPRVELRMGDVALRIDEAQETYDAILLDVDNGPDALVHSFNEGLYSRKGSRAAWRALKPGGALAVWSRWPDEGYCESLDECGFRSEMVTIPVPEDEGGTNTIFLAMKQASHR